MGMVVQIRVEIVVSIWLLVGGGCGPTQADPSGDGGETGATTDGSTGAGSSASQTTALTDGGSTSTTTDVGTGPAPACQTEGFLESFAAWRQLQTDNGSTYYMAALRRDEGIFGKPLDSGCTYTHTVQVTGGVVTHRTMVTNVFGDHDINFCDGPWEELGDELGSHPFGVQPWTMETHYDVCCDQVLTQDPLGYDISFGTFPNGVMRVCSYEPKICYDGPCSFGPEGYPNGIMFSEVQFGAAPSTVGGSRPRM